MTTRKSASAAVVIIGNEVLSGRTPDANLLFLARALDELGIRVREARVIADAEDAIIAAVNDCRARFDYVFTTGGIGPTHDDITAAAIARAFGVPLIRNPDAVQRLQSYYQPTELNAARLRMADVPQGASLLDNPISRAPGFRIGNVFVLPGVPRIMQAMFAGMRHMLVGGSPMLSRAITAGLLEGTLAGPLAEIQGRHPSVEIGSYPFVREGRVGAVLVLRAADMSLLDAAAAEVEAMIRSFGAEPVETTADAS